MGIFISLIIVDVAIIASAVLSGLAISKANQPDEVKKYAGWTLGIDIFAFILTIIIVIILL